MLRYLLCWNAEQFVPDLDESSFSSVDNGQVIGKWNGIMVGASYTLAL